MVGPDPQADIFVAVELALVVQGLVGQPFQQHLERLLEHGRPVLGVDSEPRHLVGDDAPANPQLQAAVAQVVQHADLLNQAQGIIEGQQIDQGTKADPGGALGGGGKKDTGGGSDTQGRGVVLRDVIAEKILLVGVLQQFQPVVEDLGRGILVVFDPIEDAELNLSAVCGLAGHDT